MKIISGDEFGILRLNSTKRKKVIDKYGELNKNNEIIKIYKSPLEDNNENFHLFITSKYETYTLNWNLKKKISSIQNKEDKNICSTIKNLDSNIIINGNERGEITILNFNEYKHTSTTKTIPIPNPNPNLHIKLSNIENSTFNSESIYIMYENTPLLLYNIEKDKIEFKGKNLPHDELGLRIPIYDTSLFEVKNNNRLIYVSTGYGEIRLYDLRASPKPSLNKKISKYKINIITSSKYNNNNNIIFGDCRGNCSMLDIRKSFHICKNFKGNTGSIKDIICIDDKDIAIVGGYDRFVKWYDYAHNIDERIFVKHKVNCLCLIDVENDKIFQEDDEEDEEEEILDSEFEKESNENEDNENEENEKESNENEDNENEDNENEDNENEDNENEDDENKDDENEVNEEGDEEEYNEKVDEEEEEKPKEKKFLNKKIKKNK